MKIRTTLRIVATVLVLPSIVLPARADIQTTQEMSSGGQMFSTTVTSKIKGAERVEITMQIGPMQQKSVTLTLCDKKEMYTIDEALKMYTVTPLVAAPAPDSAPAKAAGGKKTSIITSTLVSFKDLGEENIGGYKSHCYEVTTRTQVAGCLGDSDVTNTQQICVAPEEDADGGGGGCNLVAPGADGGGDNCSTSVVRKGDWSHYDKVMQNLTVRSRISGTATDGEAPTQVETLLKKVSRTKLPDTMFVLPQGFRKVGAQELQQAQVQAMMKNMAANQ